MPRIGKFGCLFCENGYPSYSLLEEHMRRHTLERPYECDLCSASFSYQGVLAIHKRNLHEGVRFKCDRCGIIFTCKSNLTTHLRKQHGILHSKLGNVIGCVRTDKLKRERRRRVKRKLFSKKRADTNEATCEAVEIKNYCAPAQPFHLDEFFREIGLDSVVSQLKHSNPVSDIVKTHGNNDKNAQDTVQAKPKLITSLPSLKAPNSELKIKIPKTGPKVELVSIPWQDPRVSGSNPFSSTLTQTIHDLPFPPQNLFFRVDGVITSPLPTLHQIRKPSSPPVGILTPAFLKRGPQPQPRSSYSPESIQTSYSQQVSKQPPKPSPHVCSVCSKSFPFPSWLDIHVKARHHDKPFSCHVCKISFQYMSSLRTHQAKRCRGASTQLLDC